MGKRKKPDIILEFFFLLLLRKAYLGKEVRLRKNFSGLLLQLSSHFTARRIKLTE